MWASRRRDVGVESPCRWCHGSAWPRGRRAGAGGRSQGRSAGTRAGTGAVFTGGVEIAQGDVLDPSSLSVAMRGREAVICALGTPSSRRRSTLLEDGTRNLVAAMTQEGVRRLVGVTLLGVGVTLLGVGVSRANGSLFYREVSLRMLAPMIPDKERQEEVVRASGLEWVLVRPPRFVTGKAGGHPRRRARTRGAPRASRPCPLHRGLCHDKHPLTRSRDSGLVTLKGLIE